MEPVSGRSLDQILSERGAFPLRDALHLIRQVAEGFKYMHAEGFLHGNLRLNAVVVDDQGIAKICDLRFATPLPEADAPVPAATGTPAPAAAPTPDASPAKGSIAVSSDVDSLGLMLYSLLTGSEALPAGKTDDDVDSDPGVFVPNLTKLNSPGVVRFLKRMTHPVPERRFASIVEVIEGLRELEAR